MLDGHVGRPREFSRWQVTLVAPLLAIMLGACSGSSGSSAAASSPIPSRVAPPTTSATPVTTPQGGPAVTTFDAPSSFMCLAQDPSQAQVTIGWVAPSATDIAITLDGASPPTGIRTSLPFRVPAGPASAPGVTIVFACGPALQHTITLAWRTKSSPVTTRVVTVTKAPTP
jgi:hypothetical protein